jgi:hypothetical protein
MKPKKKISDIPKIKKVTKSKVCARNIFTFTSYLQEELSNLPEKILLFLEPEHYASAYLAKSIKFPSI